MSYFTIFSLQHTNNQIIAAYLFLVAETANILNAHWPIGGFSLPSHTKVAYFFRIGSDGKAIMLFPGFLILMSSFTLFSGIFLTLLFDDKAVTNPL